MTRRSSLRAQARRIYGDDTDALEIAKKAPSLTLPRARGREDAEQGGRGQAAASAQTELTARVRKLYEQSAVPVAEIAALAGVTERTVYKYAAKHGWQPRYAWIDRGGAARRRRWRAGAATAATCAPDFVPVRGAGGRFVARADAGKPCARGLKATDPAGERRAAAQCRQAEALARAAQAEAQAQQRFEARLLALNWMSRALREFVDYRAQRAKDLRGRPAPADDAVERGYRFALESATENWCAVK